MKLTIKRKEDAKDSSFNFVNYDFLLDGKQVDGKSLSRINLDLQAAKNPKLTLEYGITDIEINDLYPEISKTKTGGGEPLGGNHTRYIIKPNVTDMLTTETLSGGDVVKTEVDVTLSHDHAGIMENRMLPSDYFRATKKGSIYSMNQEQELRIFRILKNRGKTFNDISSFIQGYMSVTDKSLEEAIKKAEIHFW